MTNKFEPVEWRYSLTHTPAPPEMKHTKTYLGTMEKCIERLELFYEEFDARATVTPYWRDMTAKIETREITPWRTYHHVQVQET